MPLMVATLTLRFSHFVVPPKVKKNLIYHFDRTVDLLKNGRNSWLNSMQSTTSIFKITGEASAQKIQVLDWSQRF